MKKLNLFMFIVVASACMAPALSAIPINLNHQSVSFLNSKMNSLSPSESSFKEISRSRDKNEVVHIRLQQMYKQTKVLGADIVQHIHKKNGRSLLGIFGGNKSTMNGVIYNDLYKDLSYQPPAESGDAVNAVIKKYVSTNSIAAPISQKKSKLMIYIDDNNKAHWVYFVSFSITPSHGMPSKPNYIVDAKGFNIYKSWDNIKTNELTKGGGFGGNKKTGKQLYDGFSKDMPALSIERNSSTGVCYLKNSTVTVRDRRKDDEVLEYACEAKDSKYMNLWWNGDHDAVNGGFSPGNDALYAGQIIQDMYMDWYKVPPLLDKYGEVLMLNMRVHEDMENAYWDGEKMTFGDGGIMLYPLTSLGVGAHEVSHGFTEQHSNLDYYDQAGGLNESFSDMAAQAAEFYSVGKSSWMIGSEILKDEGSLRYLDIPSKDCNGRKAGIWCSIDKASDYSPGLDVHFTSGVFNRAFYLIANSDGWDTKKAFDIMVKANQNYWTASTSWTQAACGVLSATKDLSYNLNDVEKAFETVEIDVSDC
ncbi:M4 family metallopeptidase [Gammaproteobacteria bacterium]|nr:M4 family metallopeptidase [Gammaproteobacteria bacterium]